MDMEGNSDEFVHHGNWDVSPVSGSGGGSTLTFAQNMESS